VPAVANADVEARIGWRSQVPSEEAGGADNRREQLGDDTRLQAGVGEERARRDAGAEADDEGVPRLAAVDHQRKERMRVPPP
jgi:hypothetical protein